MRTSLLDDANEENEGGERGVFIACLACGDVVYDERMLGRHFVVILKPPLPEVSPIYMRLKCRAGVNTA
jgi:hypothetical protein